MILFSLKCDQNHRFEAWFKDNASYDKQKQANIITCPECGSAAVTKAPMAPNVHSSKTRKTEPKREGHNPEQGQSAPAGAGGSGGAGNTGSTEQVPAKTTANMAEVAAEIAPQLIDQAREMQYRLQKVIEQNFDDVGKDFVKEARRIHNGEADRRNIYGEASQEDSEELQDEGIDVMHLPWIRKTDA